MATYVLLKDFARADGGDGAQSFPPRLGSALARSLSVLGMEHIRPLPRGGGVAPTPPPWMPYREPVYPPPPAFPFPQITTQRWEVTVDNSTWKPT